MWIESVRQVVVGTAFAILSESNKESGEKCTLGRCAHERDLEIDVGFRVGTVDV